jgi:hypothetical protein
MPGLTSASIAAEMGRQDEPPSTGDVAVAAAVFAKALARHLRVELAGDLPPDAVASAERVALDRVLAAAAA